MVFNWRKILGGSAQNGKRSTYIIFAAIILALLALKMCILHEFQEDKTFEIAELVSPDGKNSICLIGDGLPPWVHGDHTVSIQINAYDTKIFTDISNEGGILDDYQVLWSNQGARLILNGCEQTEDVLSLHFNEKGVDVSYIYDRSDPRKEIYHYKYGHSLKEYPSPYMQHSIRFIGGEATGRFRSEQSIWGILYDNSKMMFSLPPDRRFDLENAEVTWLDYNNATILVWENDQKGHLYYAIKFSEEGYTVSFSD